MSSSDVRAILSLSQQSAPSGSSQAARSKRPAVTARKPEGISRELYALIGDNAPSLAEAQASLVALKYKQKPEARARRAKWEWTPFCPTARQADHITLNHWVRASDGDRDASVRYFGAFDVRGPSVIEYSQFEYDQHLASSDWSSHETAYLFRMLREYDLRFVVVADRYAYVDSKGGAPPKSRSIEDIKERYYSISRRLVQTRTATDLQLQQQLMQAYSFDKTREIKRKQYASELFHLTAAEIAEEESLFIEIKRMEQTEKRYKANRDDLLRTVVGLDSGLVNLDQTNGEGVVGMDRNKKRKRPDEAENGAATPVPTPKKPRDSAALDTARGIHRPEIPAAESSAQSSRHPMHTPVYLRSTKLPVPKANAATRISDLLKEMGINIHKLVVPTRDNLDILSSALQAAANLVDMKRQVDRVEQEVRTLASQKDGYIPPPAT